MEIGTKRKTSVEQALKQMSFQSNRLGFKMNTFILTAAIFRNNHILTNRLYLFRPHNLIFIFLYFSNKQINIFF